VTRMRVSARRNLDLAAGTLSVVVLADSAVEHSRTRFHNQVMFAAPLLSSMTLATSMSVRERSAAVPGHLLAVAGGMIGTGFHFFNVIKREGRLSWLNLFYGAPVAAPLALTYAGLFGLAADHLRRSRPSTTFSRALAMIAAAGLAGTAAEAALLHFRGAFHNKLMYLPVTIPPLAALALAKDAVRGRRASSTRLLLRMAVALGAGGVVLHTLAMQREMGGWRNWKQNIHAAPPIPAPPAFTAMALAGLAALELMDDDRQGS
jgi:hypothetical protein